MSTPPDTVPRVIDKVRLADYQAQLSDLRREFVELSSQHTAGHPQVKRLQAQIEQLESTFKKECQRILSRVRDEFQSALVRENFRSTSADSKPQLAEMPKRNLSGASASPVRATASEATARPFFRWEVPELQVIIDIHLTVIEQLEREAASSYPSMTAGILLGRIDAGRKLTVTVANFQRIESERDSGGSPFDGEHLESAQLNRSERGNSRASLLGAYRTSGTGEAVLTTEDLNALKTIMRTDAQARDLRLGRPRSLAPMSTAQDQGLECPTVFVLIESASRASHAAVVYLIRGNRIPLQSSPIPLNRAELAERASPKTPEPFPNRTPAPSNPRLIQELQERAQEQSEASGTVRHNWLIGVAVLALALGAMGILLLHNSATSRGAPGYAAASTSSQLNLNLERNGAAWQLSWNADARILARASKGRFLVRDGAFQEAIDLGAADLKGSTVVYTPLSDDVVLQLEVDPDDGSKPVTESVRIVGGVASSTSSSDSMLAPQAPSDFSRSTAFSTLSKTESLEPSHKQSSPDQPLANGPLANRGGFAPPAGRSAAQGRPTIHRAGADLQKRPPPPAESSGTKGLAAVSSSEGRSSLSSGEALASSRAAAPERVPVIPSPAKSSSLRAQTTPRPGFIEPAQLLSVQNPVYPPLAKEQGISGTVEVHFRINSSGEVYDVSVSKGPAILGEAAMQAVKDRRYRAATVGGIPVETEGTAVFVFKLN